MKILTSLDELSEVHAFTIGMFDGIHLGHQALFKQLKMAARPTAIVTFSTHPFQTLRPETPISLITPLPIKLELLAREGLDTAIVLPFSRLLADFSFDQFLETLPLSHLVLGKGAAFGKQRQGDEPSVRAWSRARGIEALYIEKTELHGESISSQRIRDAIINGNLALAEQLLGRPHLVYIPANVDHFCISDLCMPPDGKYWLCCAETDLEAQIFTNAEGRFIRLHTPVLKPTIASIRGIHVI